MGGVGLSEFNDVVKHAFPQGFVRMVVSKVRPRGVQINLGPPEDNRQLIIGGKVVIAKEKRNISARGSKVSGFHSFNFLNNATMYIYIYIYIYPLTNSSLTEVRARRLIIRTRAVVPTTAVFSNPGKNASRIFARSNPASKVDVFS